MGHFILDYKRNSLTAFPFNAAIIERKFFRSLFEIQLEAIVKYLVLAPCKLGSQYIHSRENSGPLSLIFLVTVVAYKAFFESVVSD